MTLAIPPSTLDTQALGDEIAALAARLHAATYELLVLLREFDAREQWGDGFTSCAHWLSWRTGIAAGAAREKVRVARALADLPRISEAMQRGQLSYAKVRALTRVARPDTEASLLDFALAGTAAHVERLAAAWRRVDEAALVREAERRHLSRGLSTWVDEDGMVVIRGRLAPEVGAVVMRALDAAAERLRREAQDAPVATLTNDVDARQRRADALGLLAEAALSADLDAGAAGDRYQVVIHVEAGADVRGDAPCADSVRRAAGGDRCAEPGTAADVTPTSGVLEVGSAALRVSAETSRRLACDAAVVTMHHQASGRTVDVGRRTRTIPPAIRRALSARDSSCRFPGCTARRCDAHHVEHWADGGTTRLDNLMLLCRRHHRLVHEGGVAVRLDVRGEATFTHANGARIDVAPLLPEPLLARLDDLEVTATPSVWDGTPLDLGWALDVMYSPAP